MTKGTWSKGKRNRKSHSLCPRCGRRAFHNRKKACAACGFPSAKTRKCLVYHHIISQSRSKTFILLNK